MGSDSKDVSLFLNDLCRAFQKLKQERMVGNKLVLVSLDELFNEFTCIVTSLPADSRSWPLTLSSTYYSALTTDLSNAMATDSIFTLPDVIAQTSKSLQVAALREVRQHAICI